MSKAASKSHFDFIVVGAGLAGLAIARRLSKESARVLVLEGQDSAGGTHRAVDNFGLQLNNGLRLLPDTADTRDSLAFLSDLLDTNISVTATESTPLTYEAGGLKPFLGFGDSAPAFLHQIASYLGESRLETQPESWSWTQLLMQDAKFEFMPKSYVTRFDIEGDKLQSVTVNGQKQFTADQFIFTGSLALLKVLIPESHWATKVKTKFTKLKLWTQVGLDLVHDKPVFEGSNILLLDGTGKDDLGPCLGHFTNSGDVHASQWMSFLEDDEAEDSEILGTALKKIRRQIKRAFPEALEGLKFERVCVFPSTSASLPGTGFLPEFTNLHYGNGQLNPHQGLIGSLQQAQWVLRELGFSGDSSPSPQTPDDSPSEFQTEDLSSEMRESHL